MTAVDCGSGCACLVTSILADMSSTSRGLPEIHLTSTFLSLQQHKLGNHFRYLERTQAHLHGEKDEVTTAL